MEKDPGEKTNLYNTHPDVVKSILKQLEKEIRDGRSTIGKGLKNDFDNIITWKNRGNKNENQNPKDD